MSEQEKLEVKKLADEYYEKYNPEKEHRLNSCLGNHHEKRITYHDCLIAALHKLNISEADYYGLQVFR